MQMVTHPSNNWAVHSRESNSQPVDHKSDALTATPSICLITDLQFGFVVTHWLLWKFVCIGPC